jgi:hypothetical protein
MAVHYSGLAIHVATKTWRRVLAATAAVGECDAAAAEQQNDHDEHLLHGFSPFLTQDCQQSAL